MIIGIMMLKCQHVLNLAVNANIKEEENLIKKLRKIVKHIRKTQSCLEELKRLTIVSNKTFKCPFYRWAYGYS